MRVGVFDSGFGGLSVLNAALKRFSGVEFVYYADTKNVPYGTKSVDEITALSINACKYLINSGCEIIIVACNTATSACINVLRNMFNVPIVGMEPAIKIALNKFDKKTILIATPATINGEKLKKLISKLNANDNIWLLALPKLVSMAENLDFSSSKEYLKGEFSEICFDDFSSLVLGCTHFNYFKDSLREILPSHISFIDGIDGTLNRLKSLCNDEIMHYEKQNKIEYVCSGNLIQDKIELNKISTLLARLDKMEYVK
ncbi:Glutamate racemase 2 [Campylobacter majalis]|uniref:Glutamate racemase n=1 Tax=Campylobacter majalis TaxID=2790656 RepID=A0ABM8Q8K9_9BACT|nr:glutamate racemase [Campylobacter majalis]CAD7289116.1 Glutamate racemase 2 [Campylobacter majalis]